VALPGGEASENAARFVDGTKTACNLRVFTMMMKFLRFPGIDVAAARGLRFDRLRRSVSFN
jgi:hypothetical protein